MELYPRITSHFDIKVFLNCRFAVMTWAMLVISFAIKQVNCSFCAFFPSCLLTSPLVIRQITANYGWQRIPRVLKKMVLSSVILKGRSQTQCWWQAYSWWYTSPSSSGQNLNSSAQLRSPMIVVRRALPHQNFSFYPPGAHILQFGFLWYGGIFGFGISLFSSNF
jgi:hypothetical protein